MRLQQELQDFTEQVRQCVPAEVFAVMENAARFLAESGTAQRALGAGRNIPRFELPDAGGTTVRSVDLLAQGPLVIVFYRGGWCPYCNLALRALQQRLPELTRRGATLVAISPELPDGAIAMKDKHALEFPVLSDIGNHVARAFGLVFVLDPALKPIYRDFGIDLPAGNGDGSFELPIPATYIVDRQGRIIEAFVDADYRRRMEPDAILQCLDRLV